MARSKNRNSATRDPLESLLGSPVRSLAITPFQAPLVEVQDMRAFNFEEPATPRLFNSQPAPIGPDYTSTKQTPASKVPYQIAFSAPAETLVCVRRKTRREVIFAKRKNGRGGQRRAKWSLWSKTKC